MKTRNTISKNDTISANATFKGKFVASIYNSQFDSIKDVINELERKAPHNSIDEVSITNEDKGWSGIYTLSGRRK